MKKEFKSLMKKMLHIRPEFKSGALRKVFSGFVSAAIIRRGGQATAADIDDILQKWDLEFEDAMAEWIDTRYRG